MSKTTDDDPSNGSYTRYAIGKLGTGTEDERPSDGTVESPSAGYLKPQKSIHEDIGATARTEDKWPSGGTASSPSAGYLKPQKSIHEDISAGYLKPQKSIHEDIICDSCGLLKDRFGYLILTDAQKDPVHYKPVPAPRPGHGHEEGTGGFGDDDLPNTRKVNGRILCIAISCVVIVLFASIGVNIYQYLQKSNESENIESIQTYCPRSVRFQAGQTGQINCSLQYNTSTTSPSIEVYFVGDFSSNNHTYIPQEVLPLGSTQRKNPDYNVSVDVTTDVDGLLKIGIHYSHVKCCTNGYVHVNISGSLLLRIQVITDVTLTCPRNHVHTIGGVNSITCTMCFCDNTTVVPPKRSFWYYNDVKGNRALQPDRVSEDRIYDDSTGLLTYTLVFNKTACFDHRSYTLELVEADEQITRINFTVTVDGYDRDSPRSSSEVATLLTVSRISVEVCISDEPDIYLYEQNITYLFIGNEDTAEFLQAENISVNDGLRQGHIGVIPVLQQEVAFESYTERSVQIRTTYSNGVMRFNLDFNRVQCFHGGYYQFYANGSLFMNLTVSVDDTAERITTEIYQKAEMTGFVETYNITMECAARVGCRRRPYVMIPEIADSNTTYNYSLAKINSDDVMDVFIATVTTTVLDIPMSLNNTDFTCKVTEDDISQEATYTIYVLNGTFCDSRPRNCEYFYPYRTLDSCKWWVSCLNDRPRVKICDFNNLYYHKEDGQCEGKCETGCPWNL